ncbi:ATP-binding cassette (ABC) Superfamily [Phytophthora palmivora]|uniref:ATP-binding cassette (ABC) Superfamily n=1 Tax=Phytophthora palmivora TaxID=4796 RepID=A0A2P4YMM8_9STRA|nr:ATP-binding cassette (ABC) Superfamily [Phytophthora palmivora]
MPRKASSHGASAPFKSKTAKSKTAKAKSKDKATPLKETRKAASKAPSKPTAAAVAQGGSPRRSHSRSLSPDDMPNARFAYPDHSPGTESPDFDISMTTGSESDEDTTGSTKNPTPSQVAPSQDAPVDDSESSEAKAASTSSPAKNLTLDESKTRAQVAKAAPSKRADEGAAAKKSTTPDSPSRESGFSKGYHNLFDSSDEDEEEGAVTEHQEISNDIDEQQDRYEAAQLQDASEVASAAPPTPVYPRGSYPPSGSFMFLELLKAPRGLNHGHKPLFVNDNEAARCVLLAPHRIPLKEFTSLRKKPEDRAREHHNPDQAEDLFWRWVSLKNLTVQELKEFREDRLLSYVLDQRDLRIEFSHLIAKRQLHSVMEGI